MWWIFCFLFVPIFIWSWEDFFEIFKNFSFILDLSQSAAVFWAVWQCQATQLNHLLTQSILWRLIIPWATRKSTLLKLSTRALLFTYFLSSFLTCLILSSLGSWGFCSSRIFRHSCITSKGTRHRKRYGARKEGRFIFTNSGFQTP